MVEKTKKEQMKCRKKKMTQKDYLNSNKKHKLLTTSDKGITLIALIITIIVMLILVGVTVSIAINGALFTNAKKAKADTQNALNSENELSEGKVNIDGKIYNSVDEYLENAGNQGGTGEETNKGNWTLNKEGDTVTDGNVTLKIGDYVNYTYDITDVYNLPTTISGTSNDQTINQTTDLKWRILGIDANGCLTLISDKSTIGNEVALGMDTGYNNGVYILNDICAKQYSNSNLGIKARSVNIEDVEGGFSDVGFANRNKYTDAVQYGKPFTYTDKLSYPVIYAHENGSGIGVTKEEADEGIGVKTNGIGGSESYYTETELTSKPEGKERDKAIGALSFTQTGYKIRSNKEEWFNCIKFCNMIFDENSKYWLASRCVVHDKSVIGFRAVSFVYFIIVQPGGFSRANIFFLRAYRGIRVLAKKFVP